MEKKMVGFDFSSFQLSRIDALILAIGIGFSVPVVLKVVQAGLFITTVRLLLIALGMAVFFAIAEAISYFQRIDE